MPDPRDPFANLDPSKLVALDGEEERPKAKPAPTASEVEFAPPRDERVLELDLPPPRRPPARGGEPPRAGAPRTTTAAEPSPLPPRTTGPLPPRTIGPLPPRTTGPLPSRTSGPLPRPEPPSGSASASA